MSFSKNINWSPRDYAQAAVLAQKVGEEMLARLEWMTLKPGLILDAGCGLGNMSLHLAQRYPGAQVLALDSSLAMLQYIDEQEPEQQHQQEGKQEHVQTSEHKSGQAAKPIVRVCADAGKLPLRNQSVDLIFANFLLPWQEDIEFFLREWRRVLRPDGLLMVTLLGPDTLKECSRILDSQVLPYLIDMHDLGDLILRLGFSDPVLDVNHYTMVYREQAHLFQELQASGILAAECEITNKNDFTVDQDGKWALTYEVIFTHAFMPPERETVSASEDGMVRIPLARLRNTLGGRSLG